MKKLNFKQAVLDVIWRKTRQVSTENDWKAVEEIEEIIIKILERNIEDEHLVLKIISDMSATPHD